MRWWHLVSGRWLTLAVQVELSAAEAAVLIGIAAVALIGLMVLL